MKLHDFLRVTGQKPSHFAEDLGVPPSTVSRWLSGERRPSLDMLIRIKSATADKVTMEDFSEISAMAPPEKKTADRRQRKQAAA